MPNKKLHESLVSSSDPVKLSDQLKVYKPRQRQVLHFNHCPESFGALWRKIALKENETFYCTDHNNRVVERILYYFTDLCQDHNYKLDCTPCEWEDCECKNLNPLKGLYLWGDYGRGKTKFISALGQAMNHASRIFDNIPKFKIYVYKNIVEQLKKMNNSSGLYHHSGSIIMDDIGWKNEISINVRGNTINLFKDIIYFRHRLHEKSLAESRYKKERKFSLPIFTSNISPEDVLERFGEGVHGRLLECCNIVHWDGEFDFRVNKPKQ